MLNAMPAFLRSAQIYILFHIIGPSIVMSYYGFLFPSVFIFAFCCVLFHTVQVMMLHMIVGQTPGWLQAWREIEVFVKPLLALLQTRRSVRQRPAGRTLSLAQGGVFGNDRTVR